MSGEPGGGSVAQSSAAWPPEPRLGAAGSRGAEGLPCGARGTRPERVWPRVSDGSASRSDIARTENQHSKKVK